MPNESHISSFKLNKFYLTNYIQTLGSGTNKPILTRSVDLIGNKDDIVVKLMDSERMGSNAAMKELVGSLLAKELNLKTPNPCLAEITPEFIESQIEESEYTRLRNSQGINFATRNILGLIQFGPFDVLESNLLHEALRIFYFDLMIQNPDRTTVHGKPNLFTTGLDLWILDHEIAFSFLVPIIGRKKTNPWEFSASDTQMIENHILYRKLKGKKLDFSILDNYLDGLNEIFWLNLREIIPTEWLDDDFQKIADHIISIRDHQNLFINQVKILLS